MKKYSRMSYGIRCQIYALLQAQKPILEIASLLGFHKSTIYRELKRNKGPLNTYRPDCAQELSEIRYRKCRRRKVVSGHFKDMVQKYLKFGMSPEIVSGRLRREFATAPSHQSIYHYVYRAGLRGYLKNNGKRGAGRYLQRRRIRTLTFGKSIKERPQIANRRGRIGDWERDTMHTLNGTQVLVCLDRKSRFIKISVVKNRTCKEIGKLTEELISATGKKAYTVTNDNGGDFKGPTTLSLKTYFCDPMSPHQRGSIENVIRSLREYIGRKTDVTQFSEKELQQIEEFLNHRPRKVLDYKTPFEVYYKKKSHWKF